MFYNIEDVENNIFNLTGVKVKLPLPPGQFFNLYSNTAHGASGELTVKELLAGINDYICNNFVPDWVMATNPPPDKIVAFLCKQKDYGIPGEKIGEYTLSEDGGIPKSIIEEVFSKEYGTLVIVCLSLELCMWKKRILN